MEAQDYLYTTCEVAIAFTGFASLLLGLAPRGITPPSVYRFRVYSLLAGSLGALLLAMLSLVFLSFGVEATTTWRCSSGLMAIYVASTHIFAVPLAKRAREESADWLAANKALLVFLLVISPLNFALQAANSIFVFAPPFAVYFLGLVGFLVYAGIGLTQTLVDAVESKSSPKHGKECELWDFTPITCFRS